MEDGESEAENPGWVVGPDGGAIADCPIPEIVALLRGFLGQGEPAAPADLKQRGVKRQWWLVPLDALDRARTGQVYPEISITLARYQADPCERTAADLAHTIFHRTAEIFDCEGEDVLDGMVKVFEHGAAKYSPDNWRNAAPHPFEQGPAEAFRREYLSAVCRHTFPLGGEIDRVEDGGSGLRHLSHALCGALMILWHETKWSREDREEETWTA